MTLRLPARANTAMVTTLRNAAESTREDIAMIALTHMAAVITHVPGFRHELRYSNANPNAKK
jgi:hypothetical protein